MANTENIVVVIDSTDRAVFSKLKSDLQYLLQEQALQPKVKRLNLQLIIIFHRFHFCYYLIKVIYQTVLLLLKLWMHFHYMSYFKIENGLLVSVVQLLEKECMML